MPSGNWDATNSYDELSISETVNHSALQTTLSLTTTAQEVKVGASRLADRKIVILMPLDNNIYWGFSSGSQPFQIFKNQFLMLPIGSNVEIWAKMSANTGSLVIAEGV